MSRSSLIALLRERLGLDPESLGQRVVEHAFDEARRRLGLADEAALHARVLLDPLAFRELIAQIVVPETWFFRAPEQFQDLVRFALGPARARRPLRVLSLPCSSGEEAWSAAIALLDAGLAPGEFDVVGIDVLPEHITRAERGDYPLQSLRGRAAIPIWLEVEGDRVRVTGAARRGVGFRVGNALDPMLFGPGERFDVVFCRNLLIYLTPQARRQALERIGTALEAPALVLAGSAEVLPTMLHGFEPWPDGSPLSYVYTAAGPVPCLPLPTAASLLAAPARRAPSRPPAPASAPESKAAPVPRAPPEAVPDAAVLLAAAQQLADRGDLEQARAACVERLARVPDDVQALYLLGLVESGRGELAAAEAAFARVLYLQPRHLEALEHRAACADRLGHRLEARQLRERAARLRATVSPP